MKTKRYNKVISLMLVLAMLISSVVMMTTTSSAAEEAFVPGTATALPDGAQVWDGVLSTALDGSGTKDQPYLIKTAGDFMYFRDAVAATATAETYFEITNDLYFNDANYKAEDDSKTNSLSAVSGKNFAGHLNGNGYSLYNLYYNASTNIALFNTVTGTIDNVIVRGASINAGGTKATTFALTLENGAVIQNCKVLDSTLQGGTVAGIASDADSKNTAAVIDNCEVSGYLKGSAWGSKIAGILQACWREGASVKISNCVNRATLFSSYTATMGGIVVYAGDGQKIALMELINCRNEGSITSTSTTSGAFLSGGLIATANATTLTMTDCINTGDVTVASGTAATGTGGLIGRLSATAPDLRNCVNYGNISGIDNVGGLVGITSYSMAQSTIVNCANYGSVLGANYVGGIIGDNNTNTDKDITSAGGILASNIANYGDVTATGSYAGGYSGRSVNLYGYYMQEDKCMKLYGFVQTGTITAANYAAGVIGVARVGIADRTHYKLTLQNSIIDCSVKVTTEGGQVATLVAAVENVKNTADSVVLDMASNVFNVDVYTRTGDAETKVESPVTKYTVENVGETVALTSQENILIDGRGVTLLNTYATANGYAPWVAGTKAPELMTFALKLTGATIALAGTMKLNLQLATEKLPSIQGITSVVVRCDDGASYAGKLANGAYTFTVDAVRAAEIGEAKEYTLAVYVGEGTTPYTTVIPTTYSPLIYAERMYNKVTSANAKAVLNSMVQYAYAVELNAKGSSTIIDDFNKTVSGANVTFDVSAYDTTTTTVDGLNASALNAYAKVGATLSSGVNLVLTTLAADVTNATVTVNGETFTYTKADDNTITITDLHAGMILNTFTLTLNGEEGSIISVDYAIGNYLATVASNADYADLAKATALYMMAVRVYALEA